MGESFQHYSRIQDFEADFPWKVSLKILNLTVIIASDLFSVYLKTIDNFKPLLVISCRYSGSLKMLIS